MRILYLTNGFPYPLTSGYLRQYHFIKSLSQKHKITLLSITGKSFTPEHANVMCSMVECVHAFPSSSAKQSKIQKVSKRIQAVLKKYPQDDAVLKMKETVHKLIREKPYDVIFLSGKQTYSAIEDVNGIPIVADMCDATSLRIRGRMRFTNPIYLPYVFLEYLIVRRVERKLIQKASQILFASSRDLESINFEINTPTSILPNGIDLEYWQRLTMQRGNDSIVFSGGMDYPPNVDAALFLIEQVLPIVRESHPQVQTWIVGRDPDPKLVKAGKKHGVNVTGFVDDMRPYLEQATVFAAPLRFGAGIQNKVLEAMAMMLPVVASHLAADGLRTEEGVFPPIQIANNPNEFARLLSGQLEIGASDTSPIRENRQFIQKHFVWDAIGTKLENIIFTAARPTRQEG